MSFLDTGRVHHQLNAELAEQLAINYNYWRKCVMFVKEIYRFRHLTPCIKSNLLFLLLLLFYRFFFNQLHLLPWTWMCCIHLLVAIHIATCSIEAASSVENDISARLLSLFWGTDDEIWRLLLIILVLWNISCQTICGYTSACFTVLSIYCKKST